MVWTHRGPQTEKKDTPALSISHIRGTALWGAAGVFGLLWLAIWSMLQWFTNSTVPVADAFTTALSIVAMWMLARKYLEQWIAWMVVDAVCVGLYYYKGLYLYAVLYTIYTIIAILGYRKWHREMKVRK